MESYRIVASSSRRVVSLVSLVLLSLARPVAGQIDLVLNVVDSPDPIPAGGVVTYDMSVSNDGTTGATGVQVEFDFPATTTYEGFSGAGVSCSGASVGQAGAGTITCTLPNLAPLGSVPFSVDVGTTVAGGFSVDIRTTANEPDPVGGNNDANEPTTVVAGADVALTLAAPGSAVSGSSITYDLDLSNAGPDPASSLVVQFPLPTGFIRTGSLPSGCSESGGTVTCNVSGSIAPLGTRSVGSITGQISAASGSNVTAAASVQVAVGAPPTTPQDPNTVDNTSVANTSITAGSDVRVTKSRSTGGPYFVGSGFSFVLAGSYTGDAPAGTVTMTDVLPGNYTIDVGSFALSQNGWSCSVSGQTVTCTRPGGGTAGANQSLGSVSVPVLINASGAVTNTVTIGSTGPVDPNSANNTATDGGTTLQDPSADLGVTKQGPSPPLVVVNQPFNFTLRVSNSGPSPFWGTLVLTDTLPADITVDSYTLNGWSCLPAAPVSGPVEIECRRTYTSGSPLTSGSSTPTVLLTSRATAPGTRTNAVSIGTEGANVADGNPGNNGTTREVTASLPGDAADIRVLKSVDLGTVPAGEVLTYTIELVNDGPVAALDVVLTDNLPTLINTATGPANGYVGHTVTPGPLAPTVNCSSAPSGSGRQLTCTVPSLPVCSVGSCPTVDVQIRPGGNGGLRTNTASIVSNSTADDDLSNNSASAGTTILPRADVTVSKSATPDPVPAGQELTYIVTATNNGPSRASAVTIADTLPIGVFLSDLSTSPGACGGTAIGTVTTALDRVVTCTMGDLNNGAVNTVTIRVKPTDGTAGTTLTNRVGVSTTTVEPDPPGTTNNGAGVDVGVNDPSLDLVANLSDTTDPVAISDTTAYLATVSNAGPSDAENVVITLDLPAAGLRYLDIPSISAGSCSTAPVAPFGGQLVCTVLRLAAGTAVTLTVPMAGDAKGVFGASVTVESDETPAFEDDSNNTATENTTVRTRADLEVTKTASVPTIAVLRPFDWLIDVRNNTGPSQSEGDDVEVTDTLPSGMELVGPPVAVVTIPNATSTTCTGSSGDTSFTCDLGTVDSGAEVRITVPVRALNVPSGGIRTNRAHVSTSSRDVDPGNNMDSGSVTVEGSSLSGLVFRDFANDGALDGGDTGIGGVQITLTGVDFNNDPIAARVVTTAADGTWTITGLPEGTYTVNRGAVTEPHLVDGIQTVGDRLGDASVPLEISSISLGEIDAGAGYAFALVPQARVGLAKRVTTGPTVAPDSSYTAELRLVVENFSLESLSAVSITDPMAGPAPAFGTFVPGGAAALLAPGRYTIQTAPSFTGACANGSVVATFDGDAVPAVANISTLASGDTCEVAFTLRYHPVVPLPGSGYSNQARVDATGALSGQTIFDLSHDGLDPDPIDDGDPAPEQDPTPLTPVLVADVTTDVVFPASVDAGDPVVGTVVFRNEGPYAATSVGYTLTLTAGLTGVAFTNLPAGATASYDPGTGLVTFTGMPATLQAEQIASGDGTQPIGVSYVQNGTASTSVSSGISTATSQGANALPDSDTTPVAGGLIADVTTSVAFPALVDPGSPVSGSVMFQNLGPSVASGMTYALTLTPGLVGVTFGNLPAGAAATYDPGTGVVTFTGMPPTLAPGQIASGDGVGGITVDYTQPPSATSQVTSAIGTSTNQGANAAPDTDDALIVGDATVGVAKSGAVVGDTVRYDYKLVNTGNAPADSISLSDDLDAVFGAGNYRVIGSPVVALAPNAGVLTPFPGFTGSPPLTELLDNTDPTANRLPPGDSAIVRIRVEVTNLTDRGFGLGVFHNQASVTTRGPGGSGTFTDVSSDGYDVDPDGNGDPTDDDSPTIVAFEPHAEIGVAKRAEVVGRRVTFEIKLVNTGNAEANSVSVFDDLDPVFGVGNYALTSAPSFVVDPGTLRLATDYTGSKPDIALTDRAIGTDNRLAAGDSAVLRFEVEILTVTDQGFGFGQYRNRAASSSLTFGAVGPFSDDSSDGSDVDPDGNGDPTDDTSPTPVEIPIADLRVEKSGPATAQPGETLTFTLRVINEGPAAALEVELIDALPTGFTFVSASDGGTESGGVVRWPGLAVLPAGATIERRVEVIANAFGTWENVASATSDTPDPDPSDNDGTDPRNRTTTTVQDGGADVRVTKAGPARAAVGDTITYLITTTNLGPEPAANVSVIDDLPAGAVFVAASRGGLESNGRVDWPAIGSLQAGESVVDTVRVALPTAGVFVNVARASSTTPDPDPTNNDGSAGGQVETETGGIDLAIEKQLTSELVEGATATYELRVENRGSRATSGSIEVVDELPAGLEFVSAEGAGWSCSFAAGEVTCVSPGPLDPGATSVITLTTRVTGTAGESIINGASVSTDGEDPGDDDNSDTTPPEEIRPRGELVLEKVATPAAAELGDVVHYRIVARNRGSGPLTEVEIVDLLPAGFRLVSGSAALGGVVIADPDGAPGPRLTFSVGDLAGGESVTLTYGLLIGVGAGLGDGVNRAVGRSGDGTEVSDTARAVVEVRQGVFDDEGLIVGRVWIQRPDSTDVDRGQLAEVERDAQRDSVLGVPGVRVYLNDGTSAITDIDGRYSFQGLRPRNWVVRVDERTLPVAMVLRRLTTRHGGDGSNRLVDLTRGEIARADFGDDQAHEPLWATVLQRVELGPVPEVAVPDAMSLRSGTSLVSGAAEGLSARGPRTSNVAPRPGVDPWQVGAMNRAFGTSAATTGTAGAFRRPGSTSGLPLDPAADRHGGGPAVSGVRPDAEADQPEGLLVSGWVEARLDLRSLRDGQLLSGTTRDRFQDALVEMSRTNEDGTLRLGARAAAFATGRVGDETQLILRFDTEKDAGRRLFADIRPDELYDVLGDASPALFEAQSKSRLFAAVGRDRSYLMYGDYLTATYDDGRQLGRYNRTLNGVLQHVETDRAVLRAFASNDRSRLVVDEFPARGISGPYALSRRDGLLNSERVEIVTRDRTQPGLVIEVRPLQRFTDYTVEPFTGRLVFRRPIASLDERMNPVSIRVTYESEVGGERFWTWGGDARVAVSERLTVGGGFVRDDVPDARFEMVSGNLGLSLGDGAWIQAELARTDSAGSRDGTGLRLEAGHTSDRLDLRAQWIRVDSTFDNPSAGLEAGRTEMGITAQARLGERTGLTAEALRSVDDVEDRALSGTRLAIDRALSEKWRLGLSWRWASADSGATVFRQQGEVDVNAAGLRLEGQLFREGSVFTEFEQDLREGDARRLEVGTDYRVLDRARLYARHEFLSSLAGPYTLGSTRDRNATLFGIAAEYREGQSVFSEYRVGNGVSGRGAHAALGLRNAWEVRPGLRLHSTLERVSPLAETEEGDAFSATGAVEIATDPLWKATLRGEFRATEVADHVFGTAGFARKLGTSWTVLAQSALSRTLDGGAFYERTRLGLAYRGDSRNSWNVLARYEHRTDDDPSAAGGPVDRRAHVVATHANVRLSTALVARAQWAMRHSTDASTGQSVSQTAQLLSGRATLDLTRRFDVGVIGRTHFGIGTRYGLGLEAGAALSDDLRLSAGYNWFGFRDDELALEDTTDRGLYFGLGWRFDEGIFGVGRVGR